MQIRRNDKGHRAALAEIEKLWGASIGTPEGDKLDILATLAGKQNIRGKFAFIKAAAVLQDTPDTLAILAEMPAGDEQTLWSQHAIDPVGRPES
jgi:antitoxin component HigA of HigAB toxin-antitoxin module